MSDSETREGQLRPETVGLNEHWYPFDKSATQWTNPPKPVSDLDITTASTEQLEQIVEQLKPENTKIWGAVRNIYFDFSSTPTGVELLNKFGLEGLPRLHFILSALSGNTPGRQTTVTPFNPEAGHTPKITDYDEEARTYLFNLDPVSNFMDTIDVQKAPLLFAMKLAKKDPSIAKLKEIGAVVETRYGNRFSPVFDNLLSGLHFELKCQTDEGTKMYLGECPSSLRAQGEFEYSSSFMPEGKPAASTSPILRRGFFMALPFDTAKLDEKISARLIWQEPITK